MEIQAQPAQTQDQFVIFQSGQSLFSCDSTLIPCESSSGRSDTPMEMGCNDIMVEPEENTGDEGHEEAEPDTAAQRCMKTAQGFNAVVKELSESPSSER